MLKKMALAIVALAAFPVCAFAFDNPVRVDAHVSTLGGGLEVGTAFRDDFGARIGFNQFSISADQNSGGLNYKGDLNLSSFSALADWRPWNGVTHLTAGLVFNNNKLEMNATADGTTTYDINGVLYNANAGDSIKTSVGFDSVAPYLGFGWSGHPKNTGLSLSSDFGILFQGSPKASVSATGAWVGAGGETVTQLMSDAEAQLNKDLSSFKMYPVISIGIGYAF